MEFQVKRTSAELTDKELLAEYERRADAQPGSAWEPELKELRAEVERRMLERHNSRRCYCGQLNQGIGQLAGLGQTQ